MLSRSHRFHGYNSLNRTYRSGETVRDQNISLRYYPNPRRRTFRAAVVISRKVNKSAVKRNRMRRRIYESIRVQEKAITGNFDLIFSVYSDEIENLSKTKLDQKIKALLIRAKAVYPN